MSIVFLRKLNLRQFDVDSKEKQSDGSKDVA
jgi:hypothetical protein